MTLLILIYITLGYTTAAFEPLPPGWTISNICHTCNTIWTFSEHSRLRARFCPACKPPEYQLKGEKE